LVGFAALAALLWNSHTQNGVWALSPLQSCERMAFALQCADELDLDAMPDTEARWFLKESIRRKNQLLAARGKAGAALEDFDLNLNCWFVTFPIARDMFTDNFGAASLPPPETGYSPALFAYVNDLFHRVAEVVLARHRDRYFRIVAHSFFQLAIRDCTRLHWRSVSFLWLAALGWIACLIGRNKYAVASATCMTAHLVNLVGVSCFEQPLTRYVYFSEWVCLLGFLLGVLSCVQRLIGKRMVIEQTRKEHRHADLLAA
jgi:hypothetical protein